MPSAGSRTELATSQWQRKNSGNRNGSILAENAPTINHQTKKLEARCTSCTRAERRDWPSLGVRLVPFVFLVGLSLVEYLTEQLPLLVAGAPADRPYIQQGSQHGQSGKPHARQPINDETRALQVRFQDRLPPNQHAGGDDQKENAEPPPAGISSIAGHGGKLSR